jgi:hypothetical protein
MTCIGGAESAPCFACPRVHPLVFTRLVPPVPVLREWLFIRDVEAGDVDVILGAR